ncbi:MAG: helix-turn-helix domain-containing protein [Sphingomonadales bacterium]|nr:helix-turn-helix domain-containing protein [Sphingomonadales bacterium]
MAQLPHGREAAIWAWEAEVERAADRLVLVALARHAMLSSSNRVHPAISRIANDTGLDRKTVLASRKRLQAAGHLTVTGDRRGRTGQVQVIELHLKVVKTDSLKVVKTEGYDDGKVPVFSDQRWEKRDTEASKREQLSKLCNANIEKVRADWNALADLSPSTARCEKLSQRQVKAISELVRLKGDSAPTAVIKKIEGSAHLRGEGERTWAADMDWAFKPANADKILAGRYDQPPASGRKPYREFMAPQERERIRREGAEIRANLVRMERQP